MFNSKILASTLVAMVSVPGFVLGQKLRQGDVNTTWLMFPILMIVVLAASALMRQSD